ncbi:MAG: LptF/LptG family permease [Pseudomonadota bacterium]
MIGLNRMQVYILRECIMALITVLAIISAAALLIDTVEQLRTVGTRTELQLIDAIYLAGLKLPLLIEQTLPFAILISSMVTFRQLSRRAELPVMRASGMSTWGFLTPSVLLAISAGLFGVFVLSPFGSDANRAFETARTQLLERQDPNLTVFSTGIWLRTGNDVSQTVIHAESVDETGTIFGDIKLLEEQRLVENGQLNEAFSFLRRIDATTARLGDGFWQLENVVENIPGEPPRSFPRLALPTELQQVTFMERFASPATISFFDLPEQIARVESAGLNPIRYQVRLHALSALPALLIAMALLGILPCLGLARLGGTARAAALSLIAAILLFALLRVAASLSAVGLIPPYIAAWAPSLFAIFASLSIVAFREDG